MDNKPPDTKPDPRPAFKISCKELIGVLASELTLAVELRRKAQSDPSSLGKKTDAELRQTVSECESVMAIAAPTLTALCAYFDNAATYSKPGVDIVFSVDGQPPWNPAKASCCGHW